MGVKIGHASIDENGKIAGGKIGDQTAKEICIRDWYDKPWNVFLKCTDRALAKKAVAYLKQICADPNYGYDQDQRLTGLAAIRKNGGKVSGAKGEFDCSSLTAAIYILAGLTDISPALTTRSLKDALVKSGKFIAYEDTAHLKTTDDADEGDIYLSEGHHVVIVVEHNRIKNPYVEPTTTVEFGETGVGVRWVQWELVRVGYNIKIDGEFGSKTDKAVREFQKTESLTVDGQVGPKTRKALEEET